MISQKELFDEQQRKKEVKKKLPKTTNKEIKLTIGISEGDLKVKMRHAKELIEKKAAVVRISISKKKYKSTKSTETPQELMNKVIEHLTEASCIVNSKPQITSTARGEVLSCNFNKKKES